MATILHSKVAEGKEASLPTAGWSHWRVGGGWFGLMKYNFQVFFLLSAFGEMLTVLSPFSVILYVLSCFLCRNLLHCQVGLFPLPIYLPHTWGFLLFLWLEKGIRRKRPSWSLRLQEGPSLHLYLTQKNSPALCVCIYICERVHTAISMFVIPQRRGDRRPSYS